MASTEQLRTALSAVAAQLHQNSDHFRELDARVGDGDLGITVDAISVVLDDVADRSDLLTPAEVFTQLGVLLATANPSTFSGFMRIAIRAVGDRLVKDPILFEKARWDDLIASAIGAMQTRRGAPLGAKTVIDAMDGSRCALADAEGATPSERAAAACQGATERMALLHTSPTLAGRASWSGERSAGEADPGAQVWIAAMAAIARMIEASAA